MMDERRHELGQTVIGAKDSPSFEGLLILVICWLWVIVAPPGYILGISECRANILIDCGGMFG